MNGLRGRRSGGPGALLRRIALALPALLLLSAVPVRGGPPPSGAAIRLSDPNLFHRLSEATPHVFRLEPDSTRDSNRTAPPTLERYAKIERPLASRKALAKLLDTVARRPWTRTPTWPSSSRPSLAIRFGPDSTSPDLLLSLADDRVAMFHAGEEGITAQLPDSARTMLAWCVWGIDPDNPESLPIVTDDMRRHSADRDALPSWVDFLTDFERPRPSPWITRPDGEPPVPVTVPQPVYPEFAKEAQIKGRVRLYVLVGLDGRVKRVVVAGGVDVLSGAAVAAARGWVYKPAIVSGAPVESWTDVSFDFP